MLFSFYGRPVCDGQEGTCRQEFGTTQFCQPTLPQRVIHETQEPHNGHSLAEASPVCPHCPQVKVKTPASPVSLPPAFPPEILQLRWFLPSLQDTVSLSPVLISIHTAIHSRPLLSAFKSSAHLSSPPAAQLPSPWRALLLPQSYCLTVSVNFLLFKIFFQGEGWDIAFSHSVPSRAAHPPAESPCTLQAGSSPATLLAPLGSTLSSLPW